MNETALTEYASRPPGMNLVRAREKWVFILKVYE